MTDLMRYLFLGNAAVSGFLFCTLVEKGGTSVFLWVSLHSMIGWLVAYLLSRPAPDQILNQKRE